MPFNSKEFRDFANNWEFELVTSSPRYPKSNGLAEKAVGIAKSIIKKCKHSGSDLNKAILEYRTSPLTGLDLSPSELLNKRLLRTGLPVTFKVLNQNVNIDHEKIKNKRSKSKVYYDKQAKVRKQFSEGENIMIKKDSTWVPGKVFKKQYSPRSYLVKENTDTILRRNSSFIRHNPNPVSLTPTSNNDLVNSNTKLKNIPVIKEPMTSVQDSVVSLNKNGVISASGQNLPDCEINLPDCDNKLPVNNSDSSAHITSKNYITRSGRSVKMPNRFKD